MSKSNTRITGTKFFQEGLQESKELIQSQEIIIELADNIEEAIFQLFGTDRSKEYREKINFLKMRLKGSRWESARRVLLEQCMTPKDFVNLPTESFTEDYFDRILDNKRSTQVEPNQFSVPAPIKSGPMPKQPPKNQLPQQRHHVPTFIPTFGSQQEPQTVNANFPNIKTEPTYQQQDKESVVQQKPQENNQFPVISDEIHQQLGKQNNEEKSYSQSSQGCFNDQQGQEEDETQNLQMDLNQFKNQLHQEESEKIATPPPSRNETENNKNINSFLLNEQQQSICEQEKCNEELLDNYQQDSQGMECIDEPERVDEKLQDMEEIINRIIEQVKIQKKKIEEFDEVLKTKDTLNLQLEQKVSDLQQKCEYLEQRSTDIESTVSTKFEEIQKSLTSHQNELVSIKETKPDLNVQSILQQNEFLQNLVSTLQKDIQEKDKQIYDFTQKLANFKRAVYPEEPEKSVAQTNFYPVAMQVSQSQSNLKKTQPAVYRQDLTQTQQYSQQKNLDFFENLSQNPIVQTPSTAQNQQPNPQIKQTAFQNQQLLSQPTLSSQTQPQNFTTNQASFQQNPNPFQQPQQSQGHFQANQAQVQQSSVQQLSQPTQSAKRQPNSTKQTVKKQLPNTLFD